MKKRIVAILLCMAMMVGFLPALSMTASAYEKIYIDDEANFPDPMFRVFLQLYYFGNVWLEDEYGRFVTGDILELAEEMVIDSRFGVKDLTGIEYFTNLKELNCSQLDLTYLDLSKNPALEYVKCDWNRYL